MLNPVYEQCPGVRPGETDTPVAGAETILRWVYALELLDVSGVESGEALDGGSNAKAGGGVKAFDVRPRPI